MAHGGPTQPVMSDLAKVDQTYCFHEIRIICDIWHAQHHSLGLAVFVLLQSKANPKHGVLVLPSCHALLRTTMHFPVWQVEVCKIFAADCILQSQDDVEKPSLPSFDACNCEISLRHRQPFNRAHVWQMSHDLVAVGLR